MSARFAGVLAGLRKERAKLDEAIAVLEKLDSDHVADPETPTPKKPRSKNGGGRRVKTVSRADALGPVVGEGKVHNLTCKKCKAKYVSKRANGACPACHPRNVTAQEHFA